MCIVVELVGGGSATTGLTRLDKKSLWEQMFHVIVCIPFNIFVQHIDL